MVQQVWGIACFKGFYAPREGGEEYSSVQRVKEMRSHFVPQRQPARTDAGIHLTWFIITQAW